MKNYIIEKIDELIKAKEEPHYESISIKDFLIEYDYATKYLSRLLKVRGFVMYLLLFKRAYFTEGKRNITVRLAELGKDLLSDLGTPMSHETVKSGINDLVKLKIIEKAKDLKPGQINEYIVKLPSELREIQLMIEKEKNMVYEEYDNSRDDFYSDKTKRLEILKRDEYQCFYCKCALQQDNFYLDHLHPQSDGGYNWKSNLVTSCKTCNTRKNATNATDFLLENYRKSLMNQNEYLEQKSKLDNLNEEYTRLKNTAANKSIATSGA
jgi:hypothetical protein